MIEKTQLIALIKKLELEEGGTCISVIVPTERTNAKRLQNPTLTQKAIAKAKSLVKRKSKGSKIVNELCARLDNLYFKIDFTRVQDGLGFFVSENVAECVSFPFPVQEAIRVDKSFLLRDVRYFQQYAVEYFILLLTLKEARLFKAYADQAAEIRDEHFPHSFEDNYEYALPSPARSTSHALQSFERDKGQLKQIRHQSFIKELDGLLENYMNRKTPLVLSGVKEQVSRFKSHSPLNHLVEGEVIGNYSTDLHTLTRMAWNELQKHQLNHEETKQLRSLTEGIGRGIVVTGIRDVWNAAREGKGLTLFVEKDYTKPAFLSRNSSQLFLKAPKTPYKKVADVVDQIVEVAKQKGTAIRFMQTDKLKSLDRIALTLRY